jgi:hypothetical protein
MHTPRWLLAILLLVVPLRLAFDLASGRRVRMPRARVIGLLVGVALAILLGSVATTLFRLRYLMPTVPLLVCAGALAIPQAFDVQADGDPETA